jgi:aminopeptidase Y
VDYIYKTIAGLGDYYKLSTQNFTASVGNVLEFNLTIAGKTANATAFSLSPPTKDIAPVSGPLLLVANVGCDQADYPTDLAGSIALIQRGTCPFSDKSALAGKAGALAAVVYNNVAGEIAGTLGEPLPDHIATFGISSEDAAPIVADLTSGKKIVSTAYMNSTVTSTITTNVIAQTKGGDQDNCVMAGGHSDSVTEGPGINDDGSGTNTLLEIAVQLSKFSVKNCVRFAWWAGEEEGLLGSDYYVSQLTDAENLKIRVFMDYDMLASGNYVYQVYNATNDVNPVGSQQLRDLYVAYYKANKQPYVFVPFDGRSDYDAFIQNGIPAGGVAAGAEGVKTEAEAQAFGGTAGDWYDPCYHMLCDTVENLNLPAWKLNSRLVAHSVATYAVSFRGFPKRTLDTAPERRAVKSSPQSLYHGPELVM